ncbi:glycosyltransferase [Actinomyces sp. B33]|uniref:glycosyltransferase family 2 protein n=1 Tax=Actinomyces sp. B33 TaxID=2942131 RepID=UPI002342803D|nr:glycosyltransferase [Actinomyces sp. B33]MDC4232662.1 glycosyltransferase [Actinomyces sp. B33]
MTPRPRTGIAALVVTDGRDDYCRAVVSALDEQTMAPDLVILVDASPGGDGARSAPESALVLTVPGARTLGDAIRRAVASPDAPDELTGARWWWILHDDSAPEPDCLLELWEVADRGKTIAAVGPKQLDWEGERLLEVGILATRSARRLERTTDGEIDQGQYDATSDVLAVGTAGMLIDPEAWALTGGTDPALGPFGDGLDLGRRLHRAGKRVVVAPRARIRHRQASYDNGAGTDASYADRRYAQLYNWLKAAPAPLVPLLGAWLVVWTPARAIGRAMTGDGRLAVPEIVAWLRVVAATGPLIAGRWRARRAAAVPARVLRPLEISPRALAARKRLDRRTARDGGRAQHEPADSLASASLRSHRASCLALLAAVLVATSIASVATWWGGGAGLAGGAWTSLPASWNDLWDAAWASWTPGGDGRPSPADPLLGVLALVTWPLHLLGTSPDSQAVGLLVAAAPLSAAAVWPLVSRLTASPYARAGGALTWAAWPALALSQYEGRLAGVLFHIAAPLAAAAALSVLGLTTRVRADGALGPIDLPRRRLGGSLGVLALACAVLMACAPWTGVALLGGALLALALVGARARGLLVALIPGIVLVGPMAVSALGADGGWRALVTTGGGAGDTGEPAAWQTVLGLPSAPDWEPLGLILLASSGALLLAALTAVGLMALRPRPGGVRALGPVLGLVGAAVLLGTAVMISRVPVAVVHGQIARAWDSPALSLAGLGLLAAVLLALPAGAAWDSEAMRTTGRIGLALGLVAAVALSGPVLARLHNAGADAALDTTARAAGRHVAGLPVPMISAVSAQAQASDRAGRVLVLSGRDDGGVDVALWRGSGPSITDASALSRLTGLDGPDEAADHLARLALTLAVYPDETTVAALADHGVDTVLVPVGADAAPSLAESLNRAPGLERVGTTDAGQVWRLRPGGLVPARARLASGAAGWTPVAGGSLGVDADIDAAGTLLLAERADPGWRAALDGAPLDPVPSAWHQAFAVPGPGRLVVDHSPWWRLPWRIASLTALGAAAALALPLRRRRR